MAHEKERRLASGLAAALAVVSLAACERKSTTTIAPEDDEAELHAYVVEDAREATLASLDDLSRALPPMNAEAPREEAQGETAAASAPASGAQAPGEEASPTKPSSGSEPGAKAKGAPPPTGPAGVRPPRSASEAAERGDRMGRPVDGPTPATPAESPPPEPVLPTAPAETREP